VILGGVGVYEPLVKFAGGGATTPLTGFGYTIAKGIKKAVDEEGLIGVLKGGLSASSGGITAALFLGLTAAFIFKSKPKR
jgi:stage V sporulation protein AE